MPEIIKKIGEYIALGVFVLGVIIVYGVLRAKNFNLAIFSFGVLLIAIPVAVLAVVTWMGNRNAAPVRNPRGLKFTGVKIPVDLTKCEVKSNHWTSEVARYDDLPRVAFLNEISGHSDKNVEQVVSNVSRIEYTCSFNGKRKRFISSAVLKDQTTTMLLLEMQQETAIYVNPDDDQDYYFDIEFLNG